jgi:hypothetical protein
MPALPVQPHAIFESVKPGCVLHFGEGRRNVNVGGAELIVDQRGERFHGVRLALLPAPK